MTLEQRLTSDKAANTAFWVAVACSVCAWFVVGRHQWFIRDDWAFMLSRQTLRATQGVSAWLFTAQDGHWMTPPLLIYRGLQNLVGFGSYWPYLAVNLVLHLAAVLLVRICCKRWGVSAWTTTLVCSMLLVFGAGWENIVFAVQITYNLSLVAFLAQVVLSEHDGPVDRRDYIGAGLGAIGVMSSGFGPFFIVGLVVLLGMRRRWAAMAVAVVPQALLYGWWYLAWESDLANDKNPGPKSNIPAFVLRGITATFESLTVLNGLAGLAIVGSLAVALRRSNPPRVRAGLVAMWVTTMVMLFGVGLHRVGLGVATAGASRYQYMAAMLLVPSFGLAVDAIARWSPAAHRAAQVVVAFAVVVNLGWLQTSGREWANRAAAAKDLFSLIAGYELTSQVRPDHIVDDFNPDVNVGWVGYLEREHAITRRTPTTPEEISRVRIALGLDPKPAVPAPAP